MKHVENLEERVERLLQRISKRTELRDSLLREVTSLVQERDSLEPSLREINEVRYQKLPFCVQNSATLACSVESSAKLAGRSSFVVKRLDNLLSRVKEAKRVAELVMQMNHNLELVSKALEDEDFNTIVKVINSYEEARNLLLKSRGTDANAKEDGSGEKEGVVRNVGNDIKETSDGLTNTSVSALRHSKTLAIGGAGDGLHGCLEFSPLIRNARQSTRQKLLHIIEEASLSSNKPKIMESVCHLKQLNFSDEGLKIYCKWICDHTIAGLKEMVNRELKKMDDPAVVAMSHLKLVSQVLDTVAATFEAEEKFTREIFGNEGPVLLLAELHNRSTAQCVPVMRDFVERRRHILSMMEHMPGGSSPAPLRYRGQQCVDREDEEDASVCSSDSDEGRKTGALRGLEIRHSTEYAAIPSDARQVDQMLEETSHLVSCCQIYLSFVEGKQNSIRAAESEAASKSTTSPLTTVDCLLGTKDNALLNAMHDILSLYVPLQTHYFNVAFDQAMQLQASAIKEVIEKVGHDLSSTPLDSSAGGDAGTNYKFYGSPTSIMAGLSSIYNSAALFGDSHDRQGKRRRQEDLYFLHGGTISLVEDVFFFLRIAIHRSLNTNSTQIASAVVLSATAVLQERLIPEIRRRVGLPGPQRRALLALPSASMLFGDSNSSFYANLDFTAVATVSPPSPRALQWAGAAHRTAAYARKMAQELRQLPSGPDGFSARDVVRFRELAQDLDILANELQEQWIQKDWLEKDARACWQAVMVPTHLERLRGQSYNISEATFYQYELKDPWVQACLEDWTSVLDYVAEHLDPVLFDSLLVMVTSHTVNFIRFALSRKQFNEFGALQLDKDVRALRSFFTSRTHEASLRDVFAPLSLTSTLLLCDSPRDALEEMHNLALTAQEKKNVLLARIDFNKQDVFSLNL